MQIHQAARRGDKQAVLRQLGLGVQIDVPDKSHNRTPLMWPACSDKADVLILAFLIDAGADSY